MQVFPAIEEVIGLLVTLLGFCKATYKKEEEAAGWPGFMDRVLQFIPPLPGGLASPSSSLFISALIYNALMEQD